MEVSSFNIFDSTMVDHQCSCNWELCNEYEYKLQKLNPNLYSTRHRFKISYNSSTQKLTSFRQCVKRILQIDHKCERKDIFIAEHHFPPSILNYIHNKTQKPRMSTPQSRSIAIKLGFCMESNKCMTESPGSKPMYHFPPSFSLQSVETTIRSLSSKRNTDSNRIVLRTNDIQNLYNNPHITYNHRTYPNPNPIPHPIYNPIPPTSYTQYDN